MKNKKSNILIINGSIRGTEGNSGAIAKKAIKLINSEKDATCSLLTLAEPISNTADVKDLLDKADGFLVISGSYWNNWGSSLQRFIEVTTVFENTATFFGKPVACAISMDSVGGIEVASRLHAVFSGLGCWSPPCSTLVISRVGQYAVESTSGMEDDPNEDVWRIDDLNIVIKNLLISSQLTATWERWPNEQLRIDNGPWPSAGILDLGSPKFL